MAVFHGKQGSASFAGLVFEMTSYTIDATADVAESTIMDSTAVTSATHWKDYVTGFKDWTATVECLEPQAGAGLGALGTEAAFVLDAIDGSAYSGSAICTGFSPAIDSADAARMTLTFQGTTQLKASTV